MTSTGVTPSTDCVPVTTSAAFHFCSDIQRPLYYGHPSRTNRPGRNRSVRGRQQRRRRIDFFISSPLSKKNVGFHARHLISRTETRKNINFDTYSSRFNAIQSKLYYSSWRKRLRRFLEFKNKGVGPEFDSRNSNFLFGLPDKPYIFSAKFPTFCRCASFPTKLSGKNPTFFVESSPSILTQFHSFSDWFKANG